MYPDAYEVGQPNQGLAILYELLNERDWICAERSYTIWPDLAGLMRADGIPQFTLENHLPVAAFDLVGVSFSTELGYTNMLESLDLAGIPLHAADRGLDTPLVIAGGHAAFNPEPIAAFIDAAVLGDGVEGGGPPGWSRGDPAAAGPQRRRLRPGLLRRQLRSGRRHHCCHPEPGRGAGATRQAHPDGARRVALPVASDRPAGRDRP